MDICKYLMNGYSLPCANDQKKFIQQIVLINKLDIENYVVRKSSYILDNYTCRHSVLFILKEGLSGKLISNIDNAFNIYGVFEKALNDFVSEYTHSVNFIVQGYSEQLICFLNSVNNAYYFAALKLTDGTVIIYGFDNGLRSNSYSIDLQGNNSVTQIKLESGKNEEEQEMPYIYGGSSADFDNLFTDIAPIELGDFNNDFNNDFFI